MEELKSERMKELEWMMMDALQSIKTVKGRVYWFAEYERLLHEYQEEALSVAESLIA